MLHIKEAALSKDIVDLFGGIRFRYMDLFDVDGMSLLVDACTGTLETLRWDPNDPHGEKHCTKGGQVLTNGFTAPLFFGTWVCHGAIRTLEVTVESINRSEWWNEGRVVHLSPQMAPVGNK